AVNPCPHRLTRDGRIGRFYLHRLPRQWHRRENHHQHTHDNGKTHHRVPLWIEKDQFSEGSSGIWSGLTHWPRVACVISLSHRLSSGAKIWFWVAGRASQEPSAISASSWPLPQPE